MKRILSLIICLALVFTLTPVVLAEQETTAPTVSEQETTDPTVSTQQPQKPQVTDPKELARQEQILQLERMMPQLFASCQRTSGRDTFDGHCGNYVSHQLFNLGINAWKITMHGNDHYDYYSALTRTGGGYYPRSMSASEIDLEGALNYLTESGTKDIFNVMVGFEWTNTTAGGDYGHVVMIYAVLDGIVYFSESYDMNFRHQMHPEGSLMRGTISEFCRYYNPWTQYEGLVVFGTKDFLDGLQEDATSLILQTRFESTLRSHPSDLGGKNRCQVLRNIAAGERLQATALLTDGRGVSYYRIDDGELAGYVPARSVTVVRADPGCLSLQELQLPQDIPSGENFDVTGRVLSQNSPVRMLQAQVLDSNNSECLVKSWEYSEDSVTLEKISNGLGIELLEQGRYTLKIHGTVKSLTDRGDLLAATACLGGGYFQIGEAMPTKGLPAVGFAEDVDYTGWQQKDGGWYFYENGDTKTGWFTWCGVDYYFDGNGKAVTGWVTLEENLHYFSSTGALVKNARLKLDGRYYTIDENGIATR